MVLFINCCPRKDSRTLFLAKKLLDRFENYEEVNLYEENILPLNEERLLYRTALNEKGDFSNDIFKYAKQFAKADKIVIAAPFWDMSFPAMLKIYIENIYITGIVARFSDEGNIVGLCRASNLYYVTTAGGPLYEQFGYDYISDLALAFGVKDVSLIKAEMLDVDGFEEKEILDAAVKNIEEIKL